MSTSDAHAHGAPEEPAWLDRLEDRGEVRVAWRYGKRSFSEAASRAAGLGAWGVFSGFALFLLFFHERGHPWKFAVALGAAAMASFVMERVKARIEGHPVLPLTRGTIAVTLATLAVVELFIVAVHVFVAPPADLLAEVGNFVLGPSLSGSAKGVWRLIAVGAVWLGTGAALAAALMADSQAVAGTPLRRAGRGATTGAVVGAWIAPLAMLATTLLVRLVGTLWLVVTDPAALRGHLEAIQQKAGALGLVLQPLLWLLDLSALGVLGTLAAVLLLAGAIAAARKEEVVRRWCLIAAGAVFLPALLADVPALLAMLLLTAVIWLVPCAAIGALAPSLRAPSRRPGWWAAIALAAALGLTVLTLVGKADAWILVPAAVLGWTGVRLLRGVQLSEAWPFVALTGGLVVAGLSWVRAEANFLGVADRLEELTAANVFMTREPAPRPSWLPLVDPSLYRYRPHSLALLGNDLALSPTFAPGSLAARLLGQGQGRPPWHDDAEIEALRVAAGVPDDDPVAAEWRRSQIPSLDPDAAVKAKGALRDTVRALRPKRFGVPAQPTAPRERWIVALEERLASDLADAAAAEALRSDANPTLGGAAGVRPAAVTAVLDRIATETLSWRGREARAIVDALRRQAEERLAFLETALLSEIEQQADAAEKPAGTANPAGSQVAAPAGVEGDDRDEHARLVAARERLAASQALVWRSVAAKERRAALTPRLAQAVERGQREEAERFQRARERVSALHGSDRVEAAEALEASSKAALSEWVGGVGRPALEAVREDLEARLPKWREDVRRAGARLLDVCIAGSLAFWVAAAMLAGWARVRTSERVRKGPDGVVRCAFAQDDPATVSFHDTEYGRLPAGDRELFARLSLELLTDGAGLGRRDALEKEFAGFDPAAVAAMTIAGVGDLATARESVDRRPRAKDQRRALPIRPGATLVVENARRLIAWLDTRARAGDLEAARGPAGTALRDDLLRRAHDPEALVDHVASLFVWRTTTPIASWLQSVGILPDAHAPGCSMAPAPADAPRLQAAQEPTRNA